MKTKRYTYKWLLLLPALILFSCSQEDIPGVAPGLDKDGIIFNISVPDAATRSSNTTNAASLNDGFYVSAICPEDNPIGNKLNSYFDGLPVSPIANMPGYFGVFKTTADGKPAEQCVWPTTRHSKQGKLKFFAFYPSIETMRLQSGGTDDNFALVNNSTKNGTAVDSPVKYDYQMTNFKVNRDISQHVDFVTATAEGSRLANEESGVKLAFEHQLSRVAFRVWGNLDGNKVKDIEIAGIRIGRAITESDFNFAATPKRYAQGDNTQNGDWVGTQTTGYVEYIFHEGDTVIKLGGENYKTAETATSIMGSGGWATVIPADYNGWPGSDDGLYFSVLLRVIGDESKNPLLFPYVEIADINDPDKGKPTHGSDMNSIYLSVYKDTGKVYKRLYRNPDDSKFYEKFNEDDGTFETPYVSKENPDKSNHNYGWAAIPLNNLRWKPGYQYTYTLDYSKGVGVEDPDDPFPGRPIISKIMVGVTEDKDQSGKWEYWHTVKDYENEDFPLDKKEDEETDQKE